MELECVRIFNKRDEDYIGQQNGVNPLTLKPENTFLNAFGILNFQSEI